MNSEADAAVNPVRKSLLWLVAVGFFMQTLDATIINTALPAMAASLGESPLRMQSVVVAYALTMAMLIPASGWIADRFGTRRIFFSAIVLFAARLGAVRALARAWASWWPPGWCRAWAARCCCRWGGWRCCARCRVAEFLQAMSFVAIPGLIGPLLGPTLGGWLVQYASWHWIFLINVPVGLLGCIATLKFMPDLRGVVQRRFDGVGYAMLAFGMVAISLALDGVSAWAARRRRDGRADLRLRQHRRLLAARCRVRPTRCSTPSLFGMCRRSSIGLIGNLFSRLGSGCMPFLVPLLLQVSMGYSPLKRRAHDAADRAGRHGDEALRHAADHCATATARVLVVNTALVGLTMASFGLTAPGQPVALQIAAAAGVRRGQLAAVHRDEHDHAEGPGRQHGQQRQQRCCRWCRCWR